MQFSRSSDGCFLKKILQQLFYSTNPCNSGHLVTLYVSNLVLKAGILLGIYQIGKKSQFQPAIPCNMGFAKAIKEPQNTDVATKKSSFYTHRCGQHHAHQDGCIYFLKFLFYILLSAHFPLVAALPSRPVSPHELLRAQAAPAHLQCTTMGPALGGLENLTRRMKDRSPVAWQGTPWSGQPVKWNCFTSRISLDPLCQHGGGVCRRFERKSENTVMSARPG